MSVFDMFVLLFEPVYGWRNYDEASAAFVAWETQQVLL